MKPREETGIWQIMNSLCWFVFITKNIRLSYRAMEWLFKLCIVLCIVAHTCFVARVGAKFYSSYTDLFLFEDQKLAPVLSFFKCSFKFKVLFKTYCIWGVFVSKQLMVLYSCVFIGTSVIQLVLVSCLSYIWSM